MRILGYTLSTLYDKMCLVLESLTGHFLNAVSTIRFTCYEHVKQIRLSFESVLLEYPTYDYKESTLTARFHESLNYSYGFK